MRQNHISVPAVDMEASRAFYQALGLRLIDDNPPDYARFLCSDDEQTLSLGRVDDVGGLQHAIVYFECDDLDKKVEKLRSRGMKFESGPEDQPYGWREAYVQDPVGTWICLFYAGRQRTQP